MKIVLASNNAKKFAELQQVLPASFDLLPPGEFDIESPEETGSTFVENAIIKARHSSKLTGLAAIADDSGLEVDYLKGAPGIFSSRFAGENASDEANNAKLLEQLLGLETPHRSARFRCVIVMLRHALDPMPLIACGTWEGCILTSPQGENGFGYDPLFFIPELGKSSAQLTPTQKNTLSHRAQAIGQLKQMLGET